MRFVDFINAGDFLQVKELAPMNAAPTTAPAQPGSAQAATAGQPPGGVDPKQAAMMVKQQQEQKKQLQDQIKQTEQQLADLRKQLATLG